MCGITGFYQFRNGQRTKTDLQIMTDQLIHRGPDDQGIYINENVGLGHRRLSILDLSAAGHQPMFSNDNSLCIVFNGEIYNFLELKQELLSLGYTFKSQSDTEVLLKGFEEWGTAFFVKLNGIFAFALLDKNNSTIYLVRDRLGVKPLYIYQTSDVIYFASEIKAIRAVCPELNRVDNAAFSAFLFYGNALGEKTLFLDVKAVPPGHFLQVNSNGVKKETYWSPEKIVPIAISSDTEESIANNVKYLLEEAVKRQLISDVPVGIF